MKLNEEKLKICKEKIEKKEYITHILQEETKLKDLLQQNSPEYPKIKTKSSKEEISQNPILKEQEKLRIPSILLKIDEKFHLFPSDPSLKNSIIQNLLFNPVFESQKKEIYENYGIKLL